MHLVHAYVNGDPVNLVDPDGHKACLDQDCYEFIIPKYSTKEVLGSAAAVAAEDWADELSQHRLPAIHLYDVCQPGINSSEPTCRWQANKPDPRRPLFFGYIQQTLTLDVEPGLAGIELDCTAGCDALKALPQTPGWKKWLLAIQGIRDPNAEAQQSQDQLAAALSNEARFEALSPQAQETVRTLREWAKFNGWEQNLNSNVEQWGELSEDGSFSWRIQIKMEGSLRPGLGPDSWVPRFSARLSGDGDYVNPFTGEIGDGGIGGHIPLDDPYRAGGTPEPPDFPDVVGG